MSDAQPQAAAVEAIAARIAEETLAAFDWLADGLGRDTPVAFVPNPGNAGDAAINLACWRYLSRRFERVEIFPASAIPPRQVVFVGGGGNLVESLYGITAAFIASLPAGATIRIFPSTVVGNDALLRSRRGGLRMLCREGISYRHVAELIGPARVRLADDAAFALGPWLRAAFASRVGKLPATSAKPLRRDRERAIADIGGPDVMAQYESGWTDPEFAEKAVRLVATYLLGFGHVETDRLHCAILAAMLGRRVTLRVNSYFKNRAVFERSLTRFPDVRMGDGALSGAPQRAEFK